MLLIYSLVILVVLILPFFVAKYQGTSSAKKMPKIFQWFLAYGNMFLYTFDVLFVLTQLMCFEAVTALWINLGLYVLGLCFCLVKWKYRHADYLTKLTDTVTTSYGGIVMGYVLLFFYFCIFVWQGVL